MPSPSPPDRRRPHRPQHPHLRGVRLGPPPGPRRPLRGVCGLSRFEHAPGGIELLYSLDPAHWSNGLVTEAATAVLAYAFEILALRETLATTDDANTPSIRTLTRLGATPMPRLQLDPDTFTCYRLHPRHPGYAPPRPL